VSPIFTRGEYCTEGKDCTTENLQCVTHVQGNVLLVGSIDIIANTVSPMQNTPSHEADSEFAQFQKEVETIQKVKVR